MELIKLAYSPDTDDAFMVHAMKEGLINTDPYQFTYQTGDIQALNREAQNKTYHITAISVAAYPSIAKEYLMMPIGASIGDQFGPAIVVPKDSQMSQIDDLKNKKIAIPGANTSAFFAAKGILPAFEAVHMPFHAIEAAVRDGAVDAGILIHEHQLICEQFGLKKNGDLGSLWFKKYNLPLPLGANAIRRDLGEEKILALTDIYRKSIEYGLKNRRETITQASEKALTGLVYELADEYINRYVNFRSLDIQDDVQKAIEILFNIGVEHQLCDNLDLNDYLYH